MKLTIYSLKDNALGCYGRPFYDDRTDENVKTFLIREVIASDKKVAYKHKALYKLGYLEDTSGKIEPLDPELIVDLDEVLTTLGENCGSKERN